MTTSLKLFNPNLVCVKCGGDDAWHEHHADKDECAYEAHAHPNCEHIHSGCRRCGWDWASLPLDKEVK